MASAPFIPLTPSEQREQAFLANVVMPDGQTVADKALPWIEDAYATGKTLPLMLTAQ